MCRFDMMNQHGGKVFVEFSDSDHMTFHKSSTLPTDPPLQYKKLEGTSFHLTKSDYTKYPDKNEDAVGSHFHKKLSNRPNRPMDQL